MAPHISEHHIQNFLSRHTIPVPLSSLPPSSTTCPICNTPYAPQSPSTLHPHINPATPEYPVRIALPGPTSSCSHIFGRRCLEQSIRSQQPWSHVCPLCRQEWFVPPHCTRTEIMGSVNRCLDILARMEIAGTEVRLGGDGREDVGVSEVRGRVEELREVEALLEGVLEKLVERRWI